FVLESGRLMRVPAGGGAPARIIDGVHRYAWARGDTILFSPLPGRLGTLSPGLWRTTFGGVADSILMPNASLRDRAYEFPHVLPGGNVALFAILGPTGSGSGSQLAAVRLGDRQVVRLGVRGSNPQYAATGHIVFGTTDGTLSAVAFDSATLTVRGAPVALLDNVFVKRGG